MNIKQDQNIEIRSDVNWKVYKYFMSFKNSFGNDINIQIAGCRRFDEFN